MICPIANDSPPLEVSLALWRGVRGGETSGTASFGTLCHLQGLIVYSSKFQVSSSKFKVQSSKFQVLSVGQRLCESGKAERKVQSSKFKVQSSKLFKSVYPTGHIVEHLRRDGLLYLSIF